MLLRSPRTTSYSATMEANPTLKDIYLFQEFDDLQLETIAGSTKQFSLEPGQRLFNQGDPIERFYFLQQGQMKLYRLSVDGYEKVIDIVGAGQTFAEAVVFMERDGYPVNAEALEASELLGFKAATFLKLLKESNDSCLRLMANMSQRLRWQLNEIDRLTLHSATFRFINFLLDPPASCRVNAGEVRLNVPKSVLASRLSIQPETFSRILSRLTGAGLIEVRREALKLLDVEALRDRVRDLH
jgi:CRP-like cAMP-binding protein